MTKFSQLYEEEKIEYGNQKVKETTVEIALKMLNYNIDILNIMAITGLTKAEVLRLQEENCALLENN